MGESEWGVYLKVLQPVQEKDMVVLVMGATRACFKSQEATLRKVAGSIVAIAAPKLLAAKCSKMNASYQIDLHIHPGVTSLLCTNMQDFHIPYSQCSKGQLCTISSQQLSVNFHLT
jgi:hypothetical protein